MNHVLFGLLAFMLTVTNTQAKDWPQFLGPDRNGFVLDSNFPDNIKLQELWSKDVGRGFGSAVVSQDKIYFLDRKNDEFDIIMCLDIKTGKKLWEYKYESSARFGYNGTRSTPSVDDKNVYTVGVLGHITCLDKNNGKLKWQRHLKNDWKAEAPQWGFGSSTLIYKNMCIVAPLSATTGVVALNVETGETLWKSNPFGTKPGYASPIHHKLLGIDMIVQMSGDAMAGFAASTGKELWRWEGYTVRRSIPSPIKISEEKLFITGGYGSGSVMLKLENTDGQIKPKVEFTIEKKGAQIHAPILKDNYIYANFNETDNLKKRSEKQGLTCVDLKGKILWNTGEKPNLDRGSIIMINDKIVALDGASGELIISIANPIAYKEIFRQKVLDGKGRNIWAPICYTGGILIVRDQHEMKCLKVY